MLNARYEIIDEIGAGSMGIVYLAIDRHTGGEVAIKALPPALARDPKYLARFEREAQALRDLNHPNIVPFIDSFQEDSNYYLVMEYMPGGSLYDLLQKERALHIDAARQIAIDIADALIRANRMNIIHRDIKPENILFDADGVPRLADFGVAGLTRGDDDTRLTGTGTQMGTPYYMSPEAWQGERLDAQADIWSLGILLYEMLSGELPFKGDTAIAVMRKVLQNPTPDIRRIRADIPDGLYEIIRKALAKDKSQRYRNVRAFSADLEAGEPAAPLRGSGISARSGWRSGLLVAAVLVVMVAAAVVIALVMLGGDQEPELAALPIMTEQVSQPSPPTLTATPAETSSPAPSSTTDDEATIQAIMGSNLTQTATHWTLTSTANLQATANARFTQTQIAFFDADTATADAWTDTPTAAFTATDTATLTFTPSDTPTATFTLTETPSAASEVQPLYEPITVLNASQISELEVVAFGGAVTQVGFSPDGRTVAAGTESSGLHLWDAAAQTEVANYPGDSGKIFSVAFAPDRPLVVFSEPSLMLHMIDLGTLQDNPAEFSCPPGCEAAFHMRFTPDGTKLVFSMYRSLFTWDFAAASLEPFVLDAHDEQIQAVALAPDGKTLASRDYAGDIVLWDWETRTQLAALVGSTTFVEDLTFSPDGSTLTVSDPTGNVILWDLASLSERATLTTCSPDLELCNFGATMAWSPDGSLLAVASFRWLTVWDAATWTQVWAHVNPEPYEVFQDIAWSPDGSLIVAGRTDQKMVFWGITSGTERTIPPVTRNADWTPVEQNFNGVTMVLVPPGSFMMGSEGDRPDTAPVHEQVITEPFWLDKYEVTNEQYGSAANSDYCRGYSSQPDQPRNCVTWFEARDFCESRGARLPTEAEWEYAARGPDSLVYPWGDEFDENSVVYGNNSSSVAAVVGSRPDGTSWAGAWDMGGNVWEWVSTIYDPDLFPYPYDASDGREDALEPFKLRVARGGSFFNAGGDTRAYLRVGSNPLNEAGSQGVRCARDYDASEQSASLTPETVSVTTPDADGDGITDSADNCPNTENADQTDSDGNGVGDVCEVTPASTEMALGFTAVTQNADWTPVEQRFDGVTMVLVPPGSFMMGREDGLDNEAPVHEQQFASPFWIDKTEVTRAMYTECVTAGACSETPESQYSWRDSQPINKLVWSQARDYCVWRGGRLPTEAEWEFAARGPDSLVYPWGNEFDENNVVPKEEGWDSADVGSRPGGASWVGALDMSGNLWEWTSTIYDENLFPYPYDAADGRESAGDLEASRVLRGGLGDTSDTVHATYRFGYLAVATDDGISFRCARDFSPPAPSEGTSGSAPVTRNADWTPVTQDFDGVTMVLVPQGCFLMGSDRYGNRQPVHEQCFDEPFWLDKYEVTQGDFRRLGGVQANPPYFSGDNRPVEQITWFESRDFFRLRGAHLPTDREWEYAARGPDALIYPWGDQFDWDYVIGNTDQTADVGSKPQGISWVGALDMSGNVWEWVSTIADQDRFTYPYRDDDGREDASDTISARTLRGGVWYFTAEDIFRADLADGLGPLTSDRGGGFRCARHFDTSFAPPPAASNSGSLVEFTTRRFKRRILDNPRPPVR